MSATPQQIDEAIISINMGIGPVDLKGFTTDDIDTVQDNPLVEAAWGEKALTIGATPACATLRD